jgi:hypothetical protein
MEYIAANVIIMIKMNPTEYGCKLQGFPTAPQFAISRSDVAGLITGINCGVRTPKPLNCWILVRCSASERTSADVCLK